MSKQFVVLFDRCGVDTLIPCDEMKTREMLEWLGGKPHQSELAYHIRIAMIRAQSNHQRFPEVWVYDCEQDFSESEMREMWNESPQGMADLVRKKGKCLFKSPRDKQLIH
jgi:hypothetical protein